MQGWGTLLGILGLVLAFVITGMIVNQNHPESYRQGALVSFGGGFLLFALHPPGRVRDQAPACRVRAQPVPHRRRQPSRSSRSPARCSRTASCG